MVDEAEAVVVGVGDDGVDREVGDVALFLPSSLSLFTMPPSPSSWLKLGREPAFLSTNLISNSKYVHDIWFAKCTLSTQIPWPYSTSRIGKVRGDQTNYELELKQE